jgi:parallel beta-helix repeat protein/predicted outer membrane repeat protein
MKRILIAVVFMTVFLLAILSPAETFGQTIYVPDDFGTIQAALDAADDLYTIIVRDGTYNPPRDWLNFEGKTLTLRSENGAESCIIDCESGGYGFVFDHGESDASVVDGFTITNAGHHGIYCLNSSPTITNCIISNNGRSGISFDFSLAKITDCLITENGSSGISCHGSSPTITNCVISHNSSLNGGGISCFSSWPPITNCTIIGNSALNDGGGIYLDHGSCPTIRGSTIINNTAVLNGGGLFCGWYASPSVINCSIVANSAGSGGGVFVDIAEPVITNCRISHNSASYSGGGIYCEGMICDLPGPSNPPKSFVNFSGGGTLSQYESSPAITNCTITENSSGSYGGGICADSHSSPTVTNSIFSGGSAPYGPEISLLCDSSMTVSYSNVHGGSTAVAVDEGSTLELGAGNIAADPLFVSGPLGEYYLSQQASGQAVTSPCVNAGSDTASNLELESYTTRTDEKGDGGVVDMGYHYAGVYVGELDWILCQSPTNESIMYSPPTFTWRTDSGTDNMFVVDLAFSLSGPFYTSPVIEGDTSWMMPQQWWDRIPAGSFVYWRVRGADLDATPLNIIYSDEIWWFYKP